MTVLTKRYRFCASHILCSPRLSDQANRDVFGKCANPHGHGHNYALEVSLRGEPDRTTGLTVVRKDFDNWVQSAVVDKIDHRHLNTELPEFGDLVPTSENVLVVIEAWLRAAWPQHFPGERLRLAGLRLEETPRNSFRC